MTFQLNLKNYQQITYMPLMFLTSTIAQYLKSLWYILLNFFTFSLIFNLYSQLYLNEILYLLEKYYIKNAYLEQISIFNWEAEIEKSESPKYQILQDKWETLWIINFNQDIVLITVTYSNNLYTLWNHINKNKVSSSATFYIKIMTSSL